MLRYLICLIALLPLSCRSQECKDPMLEKDAFSSFKTLISKEEIQQKIQKAAKQIDQDLNGEEVTILVVLKGAMFFAADLIREIDSFSTVECIRASSYGMGGAKRGALTIQGLEKVDLAEKNVLVVEDIFDTGVTLSTIMNKLKECQPKTLRSVVLLMKNIEHLTDYRPDYCLFDIEDHFVIGYGLDYKECWRNLPAVYIAQ